MRIEFFRLQSRPGRLYWDLTDNGYSAVTGGRSRALVPVKGDLLCYEGGFFVHPGRLASSPPPPLPAPPASLLSWLLRCGLFGPVGSLRVMLGGPETLRAVCGRRRLDFPDTLTDYMRIPAQRNAVESFLEESRRSGGAESFRDSVAEQGEEIRKYRAEGVPRVSDGPDT